MRQPEPQSLVEAELTKARARGSYDDTLHACCTQPVTDLGDQRGAKSATLIGLGDRDGPQLGGVVAEVDDQHRALSPAGAGLQRAVQDALLQIRAQRHVFIGQRKDRDPVPASRPRFDRDESYFTACLLWTRRRTIGRGENRTDAANSLLPTPGTAT